MAGLVVAPRAVVAEGVPELCVVVYSDARFETTVTQPAEALVTDIYRQAGVTLAWIYIRPDSPVLHKCRLKARIRIVSRSPAHVEREPPHAIGFTPSVRGRSHGSITYVLKHRVRDVARAHGVPEFAVLGAAMAHELGHLLLPSYGHARSGVMREPFQQLDFTHAERGWLRFTPPETALLRQNLVAPNADLLVAR